MTMHRDQHHLGPRSRRSRGARGFTFTEVLFAVIILGVGFIMLAAMFPVALSQTKQNVDETVGSQAASGAAATVAGVFDGSDWSLGSVSFGTQTFDESLPPTAVPPPAVVNPTPQFYYPGQVLPLGQIPFGSATGTGTNSALAARLNQILPSDPRYAWTILYRRDFTTAGVCTTITNTKVLVPAPYAQIVCIPVVASANGQFTSADAASTGSFGAYSTNASATYNLTPRPVTATIGQDPTGLYFEPATNQPTAPGGNMAGAAFTEGTYVVLSNDKLQGMLNGRIYRLGALRSVPAPDNNPCFTFMPGWEFQPETYVSPVDGTTKTVPATPNAPTYVALTNANFYIVGRYAQDGLYQGASQELGAFVVTVKVQ